MPNDDLGTDDLEEYDSRGAQRDAQFSEGLKAKRERSGERLRQAKEWKRDGRPRMNRPVYIGSSFDLELMQAVGEVISRYNE